MNNTISGNVVGSGPLSCGGGIGCGMNSSPVVRSNIITENTADYGGGIICFELSSHALWH